MKPSNEPAAVDLVIACVDYEHTRPLSDGRVKIHQACASFEKLTPGDMLAYTFDEPRFNIAELSLANYVTRRMRGDCPYVAIPVYTNRCFRHADIYVRTDRGIATPGDLRGKRVGLKAYESTGNVWTRGLLQHDYHVAPADIQWVCLNALDTSPAVSIERASDRRTLSELLQHGEVDAVVSPGPLACIERGASHVARLYADPVAATGDHFLRTGLFPILQIIGIRNELVERHPQLAAEVYGAFVAARNMAFSPASEAADCKVPGSPAFEASYHTYGLGERDRKTLDAFLDYQFEQGLSSRRYAIPELFAPVPMSAYPA